MAPVREFEDLFLPRIERLLNRRDGRVGAITTANKLSKKYRGQAESWQQQIRRYDREGPGFVGFALDLKALVAAMVPLHVEERDAKGEWTRSENATAQAAFAGIEGVHSNQAGLVFALYRARSAVGEGWLAPIQTDEGLRWLIAQTPQLTFRDKEVLIRTRRDQSDNDPDVYHVRLDQVKRSWHPDNEWPGEAYSAFQRAIPDIERYRSVARNITRTTNSRILTNGMMWFPPHDTSVPAMPATDTPIQETPKVIDDWVEMSWKALNDDSDFAAYSPFPVYGGDKPPEFVDVGRMLDEKILDAETAALRAVGRSLDFPQQLLVEGPGTGNHWSDVLLQDDFLRTAVAPELGETLSDLTIGAFRPVLEVLKAQGASLAEPRRYRIWYDLTEVAKRPDTSELTLDAWRAGVANLAAVGHAVGLSETELLELPDDVTEYEHWLKVHSPAAGEPGPTSEPNIPDAENAPAVTGAVSELEPVLPPLLDYLLVQTAAVLPVEENEREFEPSPLGTALTRIDRRLFDRLTGTAEVAMTAALADAGRKLMKLLPKGELRTSLRTVPLHEVWFHIPPDMRAQLGVGVSDVLGGAFDQVEKEAGRAFEAAEVAVVGAIGKAGIRFSAPAINTADATAFLRDRLLASAAAVLINPHAERRGEVDVSRLVPPGDIRDSMRVAAGATYSGDLLHLDPDRRPQLPDGTWIGGDGPATGPRTLAAISAGVENLGVRYRWGIGSPSRPFDPHQNLDGEEYDDETRFATLAADMNDWPFVATYSAGDHDGCQCDEEIIISFVINTDLEEAA